MNFAVPVLAVTLCLFSLPSCGQKSNSRSELGEVYARQQVQRVISTATEAPFYKPLLPTKAVAIVVMEPLLFSIYGKENIVLQRPYEAYLIDGFWYLAGTLPKDMDGGTFELIVEAQNGRIIALTHGK